MKNQRYHYWLILFTLLACSKDEADPSCSPVIKSDLFNVSMNVNQADDHHFIVTTQITNLAKGSCAQSSGETFGKLRVYFGANASVSENDALVYEKTFAIAVFAPLEKRSISEVLDLHSLGYYLFVWTLDHQDVVDENDETNNTIVRTHHKQT